MGEGVKRVGRRSRDSDGEYGRRVERSFRFDFSFPAVVHGLCFF